MIKTWIWKLFRWGYVNVIWFLSITVSSVNCEFSIILTIVQAFNTNILQGTSCPSKKNAYIVGSTLNWYNCLLLPYIHISPVNLPTFRMEILSSLALLDLLVWDILYREKCFIGPNVGKIAFFAFFRSFWPLTWKRQEFCFLSLSYRKAHSISSTSDMKFIEVPNQLAGLEVMVIQKCRIFSKINDWSRSFGFWPHALGSSINLEWNSHRNGACRVQFVFEAFTLRLKSKFLMKFWWNQNSKEK